MRILVSGGAGFIGSHTALLIENRKHDVVIVDNFSTGRSDNLYEFRQEIRPCNITDTKLLDRIFDEFRPEAVLHLAAQSAITTALANPGHDLKMNALGTVNVLTIARKYDVKRFVFSSTSAVYQNKRSFFRLKENTPTVPSDPYGISKMACEHYIRLLFPNHLIMRYGNVYGPRQRPIGENQVIARAFQHFVKGTDFIVNGHGDQKRDFVYVEDVAHANYQAVTDDVVGTFNVSAGRSYSVNEVLREIEKIYDVPGYQWSHNEAIDTRAFVGLNVNSIRKELGWQAYTSLAEGLRSTAEWWENQT